MCDTNRAAQRLNGCFIVPSQVSRTMGNTAKNEDVNAAVVMVRSAPAIPHSPPALATRPARPCVFACLPERLLCPPVPCSA